MPKMWIALFFSYNGDGYNGMQYQIEEKVTTIQNQLIQLLFKGGFLSTNKYGELVTKQKLSRAARTDKGVHAVINAISCQFTISQKFLDESHMLKKNQLHLQLKDLFQTSQSKITYICFKKVTTRFDLRMSTSSRRYSYVCPKFLFDSKIKQKEELIEFINKCCKQFIGTHNFHNYSKGLKATDAQAKRYIMQFKAQYINDDFVRFQILGQSFVYHQIRKIIGAIVFTFVNEYPAQFIGNTFYRNQFHIPLAPPNGLYLLELGFQAYNKKNDIPQPIQFFEWSKQINQAQNQIQSFILKTDLKIWSEWLQLVVSRKVQSIEQKQEQVNKEEIVNDI